MKHKIFFKTNGRPNSQAIADYIAPNTSGIFGKNRIGAMKKNITKSKTSESSDAWAKLYDITILGSICSINGITQQDLEDILESKKEAPVVAVMVGLPCSGKSTYIKSKLSDYTVISFDNLIMEFFETTNYNEAYEKYSKLDENGKKLISSLNREKLMIAIVNNKNIVLDFTNLTREVREMRLSHVPKHYKKIAVEFTPDMELVLERNERRKDKLISTDVLEKMKEDFQAVSHGERFDTVFKM